MPNSKVQKARFSKNAAENGVVAAHDDDHHQQGATGPGMAATGCQADGVSCCTPRTCLYPLNRINQKNPGDAVKVFCNNEDCGIAQWMHRDCFEDWEEIVLTYLRSCGRARSWNEKQRLQNLWTKKGYDLAFKACDCVCGKGHLRKDLDYIPPRAVTEDKKAHKHKTKSDKPLMELSSPRSQPVPVNHSKNGARPRVNIRQRTTSLSSTGSSPPMSSSPGESPSDHRHSADKERKFEFILNKQQAAAGNIFQHRDNLEAFNKLPLQRRNSYHIKTEDEGPYGNDETRCFVLSSLSANRVTIIPCVVCGHELSVYDRYPLVDGTLFLTPMRYISDICVHNQGHSMYMNAVCMMCAEGTTQLRCKSCNKQWDGSALQVGTMYSYDVFAASPCCQRRVQCKNCQSPVIDNGRSLPFFSQYSRGHCCRNCRTTATHFVKPLSEIFYISRQC